MEGGIDIMRVASIYGGAKIMGDHVFKTSKYIYFFVKIHCHAHVFSHILVLCNVFSRKHMKSEYDPLLF